MSLRPRNQLSLNRRFSIKLLHKQGQIHLSETVAVIFIFFVLILFGAIFYYNFQEASFKEKQQELLAARAIDTTTKILFLPEISCTKLESEAEPNCFDMMKARHLPELIDKFNQIYFQLFSYAKITLTQIYPESFELVLYDQEPPQWSSKQPTFFVVALKDERKGSDNYGYGLVKVEVYS